MIREFSNQFTLQLKKVLLGSVLVFTALILGACSGDTTGNGNGGGNGGGGTTPPVYSPSFDLGTTFTIASLDDKNFARDTDNISKYSIEDVSSADTSKELIETQLKANIKTKLEKNITGTAVTFGDVGITGKVFQEETFIITIETIITETSTSKTATNIYTFTIGFAKELVKWDGSELEITPVDGVYQIYNGSHLAWIAKQTRLTAPNTFATKTVRFMNSVDMGNNSSAGSKVFTGIGKFAGRLEGNNKTIYGLKIVKEEYDVGLISKLDNGGYIDNLTIAEGSLIKGDNHLGAFVGKVADLAVVTIKGVTNHATVEGTSNFVGGLVGYNGGSLTINNSSNTGNVTGVHNNIGGLVGYNIGSLTINNSSNIGNVTEASDYVGGLVGGNYSSATITNSHSYAKKVTATGGTTSAGGIVGNIQTEMTFTANNVYWLRDGLDGIEKAVGIVTGGTFTNTGEKSKALNIAEFKVSTNFNGWDFVKVWEIVNSLYPTLKKPVVTP